MEFQHFECFRSVQEEKHFPLVPRNYAPPPTQPVVATLRAQCAQRRVLYVLFPAP